MYIIGISSYYHDSAAALVKDGKVICAVEEERFTRIKHDNGFPVNAIKFCLKYAGIKIEDVSCVAYYEKPLLKFERILETFVETYPKSLSPFLKGVPEWLDYKIKVGGMIKKETGFKGKIFYVPHHLSHAAVAFLASPFKKSAILTVDGVGDYPTTKMWLGEGVKISDLGTLNFPDSLGLFYSTFVSFLGFKVNNDEYKVMGMSAYGKPKYFKKVMKTLDLKNDGSFKLNMDYYSFRESFTMWSKKFEKEFGSPRMYRAKITDRDRDLAASLQKVTEIVYFRMLNHLHNITGTENLCLSGGVALNSLANGKIYKETPFKSVYIFGAAGDSGAAIGASLFVHNNLLNKKRNPINNLYLGGSYNDSAIEKELRQHNLSYEKVTERELIQKTAKALAGDKIGGWFQGRMEFGPRALGSRSILANPRLRKMKDKVNVVKKRESFRPFAGSVLQEKVHELFEVPEKKHLSPFMNFCFQTKPTKKHLIASIVHADGTTRIQTISEMNGRYYKLIKQFYKLTKIPCVLNTSYNLSVEPIVESPSQAIHDFESTKMDFLAIGNFFVSKK